MNEWTDDQKELIRKYQGEGPQRDNCLKVPEEERNHKCQICNKVFLANNGVCPECNSKDTVILCPLDHADCSHDIIQKIETCPICGEFICPVCGSHDVTALSRVTGYMSDVANWNNGKKQELADRTRYTI